MDFAVIVVVVVVLVGLGAGGLSGPVAFPEMKMGALPFSWVNVRQI